MPPRPRNAKSSGSGSGQKELRLPSFDDDELRGLLPSGLPESFSQGSKEDLLKRQKEIGTELISWSRGDTCKSSAPGEDNSRTRSVSLTDALLQNKPFLAHVARIYAELFSQAKATNIKGMLLDSYLAIMERLVTGPSAPSSSFSDPSLPLAGAAQFLPFVAQSSASISAALLLKPSTRILVLSGKLYGVDFVMGFLAPFCQNGGPKNMQAGLKALTQLITECGTGADSGFTVAQFRSLAKGVKTSSGFVTASLKELQTLVEGPPIEGVTATASAGQTQSSMKKEVPPEEPKKAVPADNEQKRPVKKTVRPAKAPEPTKPRPGKISDSFPNPETTYQLRGIDEERVTAALPQGIMDIFGEVRSNSNSFAAQFAIASSLAKWSSGERTSVDLSGISEFEKLQKKSTEARALTDQMLADKDLMGYVASIHATLLNGMKTIQARQQLVQSFNTILQRVIDSPSAQQSTPLNPAMPLGGASAFLPPLMKFGTSSDAKQTIQTAIQQILSNSVRLYGLAFVLSFIFPFFSVNSPSVSLSAVNMSVTLVREYGPRPESGFRRAQVDNAVQSISIKNKKAKDAAKAFNESFEPPFASVLGVNPVEPESAAEMEQPRSPKKKEKKVEEKPEPAAEPEQQDSAEEEPQAKAGQAREPPSPPPLVKPPSPKPQSCLKAPESLPSFPQTSPMKDIQIINTDMPATPIVDARMKLAMSQRTPLVPRFPLDAIAGTDFGSSVDSLRTQLTLLVNPTTPLFTLVNGLKIICDVADNVPAAFLVRSGENGKTLVAQILHACCECHDLRSPNNPQVVPDFRLMRYISLAIRSILATDTLMLSLSTDILQMVLLFSLSLCSDPGAAALTATVAAGSSTLPTPQTKALGDRTQAEELKIIGNDIMRLVMFVPQPHVVLTTIMETSLTILALGQGSQQAQPPRTLASIRSTNTVSINRLVYAVSAFVFHRLKPLCVQFADGDLSELRELQKLAPLVTEFAEKTKEVPAGSSTASFPRSLAESILKEFTAHLGDQARIIFPSPS